MLAGEIIRPLLEDCELTEDGIRAPQVRHNCRPADRLL